MQSVLFSIAEGAPALQVRSVAPLASVALKHRPRQAVRRREAERLHRSAQESGVILAEPVVLGVLGLSIFRRNYVLLGFCR